MSISVSIVKHRSDSIIAPAYVQISMFATTSTFTTKPFRRCLYRIDWGDSGGGDHAYGAVIRDRNLSRGCIAGHVYRTAGTKTITVTVFDGETVKSGTASVTVTDPATVYSQRHFFSNDTTYAGGTPAHNGTTVFRHDNASDFDSEVTTNIATNRALYFEWGDSFAQSTNFALDTDGPWTIGANPHGSGTRPVVTGNSGISFGNETNHDFGDFRFVSMTFDGTSDDGTAIYPDGGIANGTWDDCVWQNWSIGVNSVIETSLDLINAGGIVAQLWNGWCFHACDMQGMGAYCILIQWRKSAIIGSRFTGALVSGDSHVVRTGYVQDFVVDACEIGSSAELGTALTIRGVDKDGTATIVGDGGGDVYTERFCITNTKLIEPFGVTFKPVSLNDETWHRHGYFDGNWLIFGNAQQYMMEVDCSELTVSNNLFDASLRETANLSAIWIRQTSTNPTEMDAIDFIGNTIFSSAVGGGGQVLQGVDLADPVTNLTVRNNLFSAPNWTGTEDTINTNATQPGAGDSIGNNGTDDDWSVDPTFVAPTGARNLPEEFLLDAGSFGIAGGAETGVFLHEDFFRDVRDGANQDIGFDRVTAGTLPPENTVSPLAFHHRMMTA